MIRKVLILASFTAALALAACNTPTGGTSPPGDPGAAGVEKVILTAKQGLTAARGAQFLFCDAVAKAHTSGVLTGDKFNDARAGCIKADDYLDAADAALATGDTIAAALAVRQGLDALAEGQKAAPGLVPPS